MAPEISIDIGVVRKALEDASEPTRLLAPDDDGVGLLRRDFVEDALLDEKAGPNDVAGVFQPSVRSLDGFFSGPDASLFFPVLVEVDVEDC